MTVNPARQMKKLEKALRAWCTDPTTDRREQIHQSLRKWLASSHPRSAAAAAVDLHALAIWHAHHGALATLEGRIEGWADIDRVLKYEWWSLRINNDTSMVSHVALILAHAMVFEEESMAEWVAHWLLRSLEDSTSPNWSCATFGAFILKLWTMQRGLPDVDVARPNVPPLGVYQRVLDAWANPDELRPALSEACDYHLSQSWTARGYPEFVDSPYQMFPVDMLAIATVRRALGLEMPRVEHPLLATPLATPPPRGARPEVGEDAVLEQLITKARATGFL